MFQQLLQYHIRHLRVSVQAMAPLPQRLLTLSRLCCHTWALVPCWRWENTMNMQRSWSQTTGSNSDGKSTGKSKIFTPTKCNDNHELALHEIVGSTSHKPAVPTLRGMEWRLPNFSLKWDSVSKLGICTLEMAISGGKTRRTLDTCSIAWNFGSRPSHLP